MRYLTIDQGRHGSRFALFDGNGRRPRVGSGWVTTPAFSTLLAIMLLFIMQNVFELAVHQ